MREVNIKIRRFDPSKDTEPYQEQFAVPYTKGMRVLDAIKHIQTKEDGTLGFRYNCQMGICGSCAMEVDGRPVLTCKEELKPNLLGVKIAPLRAFPVMKDLAADYHAVYEREKHMDLHFAAPAEKRFYTMHESEVKEAHVFRTCIECMICVDSCRPVRDGNNDFLGPKSIVKAMQYEYHPKDTGNRVSILERENIWRCNITRCCQNTCPQKIPITDRGILPTLSRSRG